MSLENSSDAYTSTEIYTISGVSLFTDFDISLFRSGKHFKLYEKLGAHIINHNGVQGTYFAVWAPNAERVSLVGTFNFWNRTTHPLYPRWDGSGIWEGFVPNIGQGELYKYFIRSHNQGYEVEKGDPFGLLWETPPNTASVIWDINYQWNDSEWLQQRRAKTGQVQPYSVYEVHLGSWKRSPEEGNRSLSYRELADELPAYVKELGFTHVEFLPVMEHPFYGSWGYQITGYFAPSSRYGTPQDFMHLIESFHQAGIGVILDWVPSHFPEDQHGLAYFDGTNLYEHADPRKGWHPDWKSLIFNYGRNEVRAFLISNAIFWLDKYHADGLRVDAVASMLYLDYSRNHGEWIPNQYGGRENLEAISLIQEFNTTVYQEYPDVHTIAEESTAYAGVSRPVYTGGLGFGMKWMMGWMHDTLKYMSTDPLYRRYHQGQITFSIIYAFHENFMLPLSHDEVVHGKNPLIYKMPGDEWQKFANLRLLYGYMFAHPGMKLLFMGDEFAQTREWNHDRSLDWHLTQYDLHKGVMNELKQLNHLFKTEKALYELSFDTNGFEWLDYGDADNSVISFLRKDSSGKEKIAVICNFTPQTHQSYRIGVPEKGTWVEIFNSDAREYAGSDSLNKHSATTELIMHHGKPFSITITLPPLGVVFLKEQ
ncbi:1,4-alpha-glucan branching protein GlgB [Cytophagaceae bacterium DM2B3-1]|uniref:1,4-alpha-glucan branching enzyme GlgB n=1 Tax=Xanthocytophaga flava TaxID=3048013 RepID=A0ABT7CRM6_9BACT|nr:1,4-alpha-glucan branching protein GlgB [Xanthocytophaga flavus]MDJ1496411.1 1,4-alpha-glucan branching protein GlgB [Xanthocytophaga flavus]